MRESSVVMGSTVETESLEKVWIGKVTCSMMKMRTTWSKAT